MEKSPESLRGIFFFHQISTFRLSDLTIGSPGLQPKAFAKAAMLLIGPLTRKAYGPCTSTVSSSLEHSGLYLPRQIWAQPRKNRWSAVSPSIGAGSGLPSRLR